MKTCLRLVLLAACLFVWTSEAALTAKVRMFSWSLNFSRGQHETGLWSLDLSGLQQGINGELVPVYDNISTHYSQVYLNDETLFDDPIPGNLDLNVPDFMDANGDGFDDFFDVSMGANASTTGAFNIPTYGSGTVTARWTRSAGSPLGTCVLTFKISQFQSLGSFTHQFQVLEYKGTIDYVPGNTAVTGVVSVVQSGAPDNTLGGPFVFVKSLTNSPYQLELQGGTMTNQAMQQLEFLDDSFWYESKWPTNYYGSITFNDGDPSTAGVDYDLWTMSIDDLNDSDKDGLPDFNDNPVALPARRPVLRLIEAQGSVSLGISADVGTSWQIEQAPSPLGPWGDHSTVQITSDPQTIPLGSKGTDKFYRLRKL